MTADVATTPSTPASLVACHDCDLLQSEAPLPRGGSARCSRCGAVLYRAATDMLDRTISLRGSHHGRDRHGRPCCADHQYRHAAASRYLQRCSIKLYSHDVHCGSDS
jgi:uncharacterized paraquat-inducible protein A